MALSTENISKTLIIPPDSSERFVSFPHYPSGTGWFDNGVVLAGISDLTPGYLVRHTRARYHFSLYCTAGQAQYQGGDGGGELSEGMFMFMPAGGMQCLTSRQNFQVMWWLIDPDHVRWEFIRERQESFCRPWRCGAMVVKLEEMLYAESQSPSANDPVVAENFCRLVLSCLERELACRKSSHEVQINGRLEKLWLEVRRDLAYPWRVSQMARAAGMSVSHFYATVSSYCHASPQEVIRNLRLDQVKSLLLNSDCKLEEIAEMTGYSSAFSLSRSFTKQLGICPREFRSRNGRSG